MPNHYAYLPTVDEFHIDSPHDDPDRVTVSLLARDADGIPGVVKFTLDGEITYPSNHPDHTDLTLPLAEDFLQQFAAIMGYRVDKS